MFGICFDTHVGSKEFPMVLVSWALIFWEEDAGTAYIVTLAAH